MFLGRIHSLLLKQDFIFQLEPINTSLPCRVWAHHYYKQAHSTLLNALQEVGIVEEQDAPLSASLCNMTDHIGAYPKCLTIQTAW